ncbi:MAG: hypothetical protein JWM71_1853 [Solirubrobacteraceae bacterium]|nr:hypothetical protein [Solirubrobacteraceae bacterium]
MSDDTIQLGPNQRLTVVAATPERLVLDARWQPGDPPPPHLHPGQDEHFEVLEGELTVVVGTAEPRILRAGDTLDVPRGTAHRMWNAGPAAARAGWEVAPALRTEQMFRTLAAGVEPQDAARFLEDHRAEFRLVLD